MSTFGSLVFVLAVALGLVVFGKLHPLIVAIPASILVIGLAYQMWAESRR